MKNANRIIELQNFINTERNVYLNEEELVSFLYQAMNLDSFQIKILKLDLHEIEDENTKELLLEDMLNLFLEETCNEEILRLYDSYDNFDEKNIESIRNHMEESEFPQKVYRLKNPNLKPTKVELSDESLEKNTKMLLDFI